MNEATKKTLSLFILSVLVITFTIPISTASSVSYSNALIPDVSEELKKIAKWIIDSIVDFITDLVKGIINFVADIPINILNFFERQIEYTEDLMRVLLQETPFIAFAAPLATILIVVFYGLLAYVAIWIYSELIPFL
ncbi:MAG: hypothetical protein ACOC53_05395 [Candidatus Saliniplasma sp.]